MDVCCIYSANLKLKNPLCGRMWRATPVAVVVCASVEMSTDHAHFYLCNYGK